MKNKLDSSLLIGIDGLGGSGKTTYAFELQKKFADAFVFHLDDFIHPKEIRYNADFDEWYCYYFLQWRYNYFIEKLLHPLEQGKAVNETIEFYDKEINRYQLKKIDIPADSTVIVEGVFLQRPELRSYFDKVLFIDVNKEERLNRVLQRDVYLGNKNDIIEKYNKRYFPAEEVYMKECNPLTLADEIHRM